MMMRATRPWLVLILAIICAVSMCRSAATLPPGAMEVKQLCESQCQQQSFRFRQVTAWTDNKKEENCKGKCIAHYNYAKTMKTLQEANWDWKDVACAPVCVRLFTSYDKCMAQCRSTVPWLMNMKTREEANWDWKDVACSWCYGIPHLSEEEVESCVTGCREHMLPGLTHS